MLRALAVAALTLSAAVVAKPSADMMPARVEARATSTSSTTLPTITTSGKAFWNGTERFYIRGVDYQPGGSSNVTDPLATYSTCSRDIPYFTKLGVNAIRVYTVDNTANHDECMAALADAGIYLILDVNTPEYSLNRDDPAVSYNAVYLQSIFATIDAFATYTNTLAFFSGNEVINSDNTTDCAPYIKAVTRDMKQYLGERGYRKVPVGYSAADVSENQYLMAQYMDCGESQTISDFYAINNYEWCDPSSYTESGWETLVAQYTNYSLPVFLSEYGCITNTRYWNETTALYAEDMTSSISGGLAYEYSEESNGYGLVTIDGDTVTDYDNQFTYYKAALASVDNPSGTGNLSTDGVVQDCPSQGTDWDTSPWLGSALPALPSGALKYYEDGAGTGPGLTGTGSQDDGTTSLSTAASDAGEITTTYSTVTGTASSSSSSSSGSSSSGAGRSLGENDVRIMCSGLVVALCVAFGAALL